MAEISLTPEELLAGAAITFDVVIPLSVLRPGQAEAPLESPPLVQMRPLTIGTFQLIMKAAKQDAGLIPLLMIKESLVQPSLSLEQIKRMHLGLVNFLVIQIREISGLTEKKSPLTS
ncbi:MAG: hypothetical protein IM473_21980 [Microcystis sp. M015S2]|uniref:hypothetical protein n=1 Tax=unclassified Microcystis TaxID=2643300 RepID=UPI0025907277|nr:MULTISPECIES: hypothetical protein [unclassified Microcystis]MCA2709478.1 hypothetical protein [Microcystis sp. M025S2]MCA2744968.1 hypothetical protein [Microcystis sp. M015S2]MCA2760734.1 hypothetical protein [Microcystis sp. M145S2]